jgi:large subunit ribosomal protein L24
MARIKKGDLVVVRSGADAGKRGRVLRMLPDDGRAIVEGVNLVFKHLRKSQKHPQGGRVRREASIGLSKLMPVDPTTDKGTRVSFRVEGGEKRRVGRKSGAVLEAEGKPRGKRAAPAKSEG